MNKKNLVVVCLVAIVIVLFLLIQPFSGDEKEIVRQIEFHQPGVPPAIPHTVESRRKCIACHASAGTPEKLQTSHPERENCMQCHVPQMTKAVFSRKD